MLLNEQKDGQSRVCYFDSSNLICCKYLKEDKKLAVIFKDGRQYLYEGVVDYHFQRFKVAKSQGEALTKYITANYPYTVKTGKTDVSSILQQIENLKSLKSNNDDINEVKS